jgi:hypothetical protein
MDINGPFGVVDKRNGRGVTAATSIMAEFNNNDTIGDVRARLAAINGTTFTAARLDSMTENDMLYALRVHSADAAGI